MCAAPLRESDCPRNETAPGSSETAKRDCIRPHAVQRASSAPRRSFAQHRAAMSVLPSPTSNLAVHFFRHFLLHQPKPSPGAESVSPHATRRAHRKGQRTAQRALRLVQPREKSSLRGSQMRESCSKSSSVRSAYWDRSLASNFAMLIFVVRTMGTCTSPPYRCSTPALRWCQFSGRARAP